jgi:polyhydroxyalkanoate synthesis regulator phasin
MPQPKSSSSRNGSSRSGGARSGTASSSRSRKPRATSGAAPMKTEDPGQAAGLVAVRGRLSRGVVVTAESIQETLDEAVTRGRMTRDDAQELAHDMVSRGRQQAEDFLRDVEALLGRGRVQAGRQAASARKQAAQRGDRVLREVDRARRAAGIGSFPILGYDDLDARQVTARLADLSPAELRKVRTYEKKNRGRKTILRAVEKQLG